MIEPIAPPEFPYPDRWSNPIESIGPQLAVSCRAPGQSRLDIGFVSDRREAQSTRNHAKPGFVGTAQPSAATAAPAGFHIRLERKRHQLCPMRAGLGLTCFRRWPTNARCCAHGRASPGMAMSIIDSAELRYRTDRACPCRGVGGAGRFAKGTRVRVRVHQEFNPELLIAMRVEAELMNLAAV